MKITTVQEAFNVSIDPNATPAQKGAATKVLKANLAQAQDWFNSQSRTQEQKFQATLDRIIGLAQS